MVPLFEHSLYHRYLFDLLLFSLNLNKSVVVLLSTKSAMLTLLSKAESYL